MFTEVPGGAAWWEMDEGTLELVPTALDFDDKNPSQPPFFGQATALLDPSWWTLDREPGMDDMVEKAGDAIKKMREDLKVYPFQDTDGEPRLFLVQFEFPKESTKAPKINFMVGMPKDCIEMIMHIGQISTIPDEIEDVVLEGNEQPTPPFIVPLFEWPDMDRVLLNVAATKAENVELFAEPLPEGEDTTKPHWWLQLELLETEGKKWPVPGELLCLVVRIFPAEPWGKQKSSPFIWSANFFDSVYLSGGIIKEIQEPTDDQPYPTYTVAWHGKKGEYIENVRPSDFAEYKVDDFVAILKDVATEKEKQTWKDEDMTEFNKEKFVIAPITYYGIGYEEE